MPDWEHTTLDKVKSFLSLLLTNIRGIYDDGWWWWVVSGISCLWVVWGGCMMGFWWGEIPSFYSKIWGIFAGVNFNIRHFCWWKFEPWLLIGYESWTMYSDFSELNPAPWWAIEWLLKYVIWIMTCDWSELDDWKTVSWTVSCGWSQPDEWILKADWSQPHGWKLNPDWLILTMYL